MEHARQRSSRERSRAGFLGDAVITTAHNCAVLRIPFDSSRLFREPPGEYLLALRLVVERVSETNRIEQERASRQ